MITKVVTSLFIAMRARRRARGAETRIAVRGHRSGDGARLHTRGRYPMGMTLTQKIIAAHSGLPSVSPGQIVNASVDLAMSNDITTTVATKQFYSVHNPQVFDRNKCVVVLDHYNPCKDVPAAQQCKECREFAYDQKLTNFFDVGTMGIEHALLPEKGLVKAGDVVIGADSHTCTYGALGAFSTGVGSTDIAAVYLTGKCWLKVPPALKFNLTGKPAKWISGKDIILHIIGLIGVDGALYRSMEYTGDGVQYLTMDDRFTICNMAIEAGAKNGIFPVDAATEQYMAEHGNPTGWKKFVADPDAVYEKEYTIDLSKMKPTVSFPHLPENAKEIGTFGDIEIHQAIIGSCTNGRLNDLKIAAEILKGRKVNPRVRTIIIPATQKIYLQAMDAGYIKTFIEAGCAVSTPTCGPCIGGYMGILASGERCVATTNRNFRARMGHVDSEVYLASPAVAAASAIAGRIVSPEEV